MFEICLLSEDDNNSRMINKLFDDKEDNDSKVAK